MGEGYAYKDDPVFYGDQMVARWKRTLAVRRDAVEFGLFEEVEVLPFIDQPLRYDPPVILRVTLRRVLERRGFGVWQLDGGLRPSEVLRFIHSSDMFYAAGPYDTLGPPEGRRLARDLERIIKELLRRRIYLTNDAAAQLASAIAVLRREPLQARRKVPAGVDWHERGEDYET